MSHIYKNTKGRIYSIESYQSSWPERFVQESKELKEIFGNKYQIEHIGSTSVPGMLGKSCIDILVIVDNISEVESYISLMENIGYEYKKDIVMPGAHLFRKYKEGKAW